MAEHRVLNALREIAEQRVALNVRVLIVNHVLKVVPKELLQVKSINFVLGIANYHFICKSADGLLYNEGLCIFNCDLL